jgi:NAD-dependent dihydropyrimidine dehydrogenase PreA subunit
MNLMMPVIDPKKCTLCGECINACKLHVLDIQNERVIFIKPEYCNYCATCEGVCAQGAIRVEYEIGW